MSFNVQLESIKKYYGDVRANDGVDISIQAGSIHALIGENGAGKSTAMKILFGLETPNQGKIKVDNEFVTSWRPQLAFQKGFGMVHQHFMLASNETVLDNLVLGVEDSKIGLRDRISERAKLEKLMSETGLKVPLDKKINEIPVGLQSRCEILKVLYRKASFLILDEPTAVLTPQEIEEFLKTLQTLRAQGKTILIVTHKLQEVMAIADEATILRNGKTIATRKIKDTSIEELSELMVGRKLVMPKASSSQKNQTVRLSCDFNQSKFDLISNQITGIAGVEGNGQEELISAVLKEISNHKIPFGYIPSDRHHDGIILEMNLYENLRLNNHFHPSISDLAPFSDATHDEIENIKRYDVRPANVKLTASALSGGNQQKLIVARELSSLPEHGVLIAVHPTRGVDLGAIEFIHEQMLKATSRGIAVLLISSELEELMSLSNKIGTIYNHKINKWFEGPKFNESEIGFAMLGGVKS